jgi:hypothetical protein
VQLQLVAVGVQEIERVPFRPVLRPLLGPHRAQGRDEASELGRLAAEGEVRIVGPVGLGDLAVDD